MNRLATKGATAVRGGVCGTPAFRQSVSDARQGSRSRSGTAVSAAIELAAGVLDPLPARPHAARSRADLYPCNARQIVASPHSYSNANFAMVSPAA
jgi:hypothetical protein